MELKELQARWIPPVWFSNHSPQPQLPQEQDPFRRGPHELNADDPLRGEPRELNADHSFERVTHELNADRAITSGNDLASS